MEYPKFDSMTVTIFPRHLEWLNRRFRDAGINRSLSVREALELLIAKYPDVGNDAGGVASKSSEVSDDDDAIAPRYEAPEVITSQDDETLERMGAGGEACPACGVTREVLRCTARNNTALEVTPDVVSP